MKERLAQFITLHCGSCLQRLRDFNDRYLTVKLLHAWVLGFLAIGYVGYAAPLALQSLVLVAAKVWLGALMGYFLGRAVFPNDGTDATRFCRVAVMAAAVVGMSLGV